MNNNNKNVNQSGNEFSLFVGDLPHDCSDETLERLFQSRFKSVKRVQIIRNEDGSSRGFGFIRFEDQTDFKAALSQQMKIGNATLRLDAAHRYGKNSNRGRYNSFNSTASNSSNHHNHHPFNNSNSNLHHHHHHHNQPHHHPQHHPHSQHRHQHGNQQTQSSGGANNNNKSLVSEHAPGNQHQQLGPNNQASGRNNNNTNNSNNNNNSNSNPSQSGVLASDHQQQQSHHQQQQQQQQSTTQQQHHTTQLGHNLYSNNPQKNSHQPSPDLKQGSKNINLSLTDDTAKLPNQTQQSQTQPLSIQQPALISPQAPPTQQTLSRGPQSQHALSQVPNNPVGSLVAGVNITASTTTTATTTMPITSVNSHGAASVMHNSQQNLNTTHQQAIGPDLRGYVHPGIMDSHLLVAGEQASVVPPTSVYGHMYPYGPPPPFGYMPPPPQPNPVMPISAVPPAPPNSAPTAGGVGQHSLTGTAVGPSRFNGAQQSSHHHSHPQHHPHHHQQPQQPAHVPQAGVDASGLGAMAGGVQATHQGPFYYYYHSPLYFDQTGGAAGAPPNHMYHPQTFHPQFFAVPGPAYLPNAHNYNQHQAQPPSASQSDATLLNQQAPQQQVPPPPPPHQQQQQQQQQTKDR